MGEIVACNLFLKTVFPIITMGLSPSIPIEPVISPNHWLNYKTWHLRIRFVPTLKIDFLFRFRLVVIHALDAAAQTRFLAHELLQFVQDLGIFGQEYLGILAPLPE